MATRKKETVPAASSNVIKGAEPYQPKMSAATSKSIIKSEVGQRVKLSVYRSTVTPLTPTERELIIDQALAMLERTYAHLPLKRALHANDPIQSLKLLRLRHSALEERAFQSAVMDVFLGLRDLHTNYILPNAYRSKFAFVPFRIEEFYEPGGVVPNPASPAPQRSYVVSWVSPVNTVSTLKEGMVVTHWNGSPIDLAVARNGAREAGSNLDARRAQGVEALTLRWLGMSLPPDEDWVMLTYTDGTHAFESRFDWEIIDSSDRQSLLSGLSALAASGKTPSPVGVDLKRMLLDRVRKQVFDPQAVKVEDEMAKRLDKLGAKAMAEPLRAETSNFPDVFPRFGTVDTPSGKFGYIRLKSFAPENHMGNVVWDTVNEFIRILKTLPPSGLILDVRGNGGGYINIGELILQTLTPRDITPEGFHFLATSTTLAMASKANNGIGEWKDSILEGLESGASFSRGFPLTDPSDCNLIGQVYQGPVILITDALCYSTTDIFSSGFQDHAIGPILGCHTSTGAGGANVVEYSGLAGLDPNLFVKLPQGADMRVALRRCTRVGARAGTPVEDYGAMTDIRYYLTKADVVGFNADLIAAAAKILAGMDKQSIKLVPVPAAPRQQFKVDVDNVDRFDIWVNERPVVSQDATTGSVSVTLPTSAKAGDMVYANGYRKGNLVASTRAKV